MKVHRLMRDIEEIFDLVCKIEKIRTKTAFAEVLGLSPQNINGFFKRGTIPYREIIKYCRQRNISYDWFFEGVGTTVPFPLQKEDKNSINYEKIIKALENKIEQLYARIQMVIDLEIEAKEAKEKRKKNSKDSLTTEDQFNIFPKQTQNNPHEKLNKVSFEEEDITPDFVQSFLEQNRLTQKEFARNWAVIEPNTLRLFLHKKSRPTKYVVNMILFGIRKFIEIDPDKSLNKLASAHANNEINFVSSKSNNHPSKRIEKKTEKPLTTENQFLSMPKTKQNHLFREENLFFLTEEGITSEFINKFLKRHRLTRKEFSLEWCKMQTGTLRSFLNEEKEPTAYIRNMVYLGMQRFLASD